MKYDQAHKLALAIQEQLAPFCEPIEIAGSIRRARPEVNDLDLVLLPKPGQRETIKARCRQKCRVVTEGEQNCIYELPLAEGRVWQLDLFFARPVIQDLLGSEPGNFGSLLLCRTGSKEHNIYLIEHAKRLGLIWQPYRGVIGTGGRVLASESEAEIFTALDLAFIPPEKRER
jgi:DNA polymerase (family 10)